MNSENYSYFAEISGAFVGDGWLESSLKSIYITGDKIEDRDYYDLFLAPLFSRAFVEVHPREFKYWKVYGIGCYNKETILMCLKLGFQPGRKALNAQAPVWILNSNSTEIMRSFLRGLFDADGSFWCEKSRANTSSLWKRTYHSHPELQISSCSKILLEQCQYLLRILGISSTVVNKAQQGIKCGRNVHNSYALKIRKIDMIKKWFKIIGSNNPKHKTRYFVWKQFGFLPPRTTINQRKEILNGELDPKDFY